MNAINMLNFPVSLNENRVNGRVLLNLLYFRIVIDLKITIIRIKRINSFQAHTRKIIIVKICKTDEGEDKLLYMLGKFPNLALFYYPPAYWIVLKNLRNTYLL